MQTKQSQILEVANRIVLLLEASDLAPEDWTTAASIAAVVCKACHLAWIDSVKQATAILDAQQRNNSLDLNTGK